MVTSAEIKTIQLNPFLFFLRQVLALLAEQDTQDIFADPVDEEEVADYRYGFCFYLCFSSFYCCFSYVY